MDLRQALREALRLLFTLDSHVLTAAWTSLYVSTLAVLLASFIGIPVGFLLGIHRFKGREVLLTVFNILMALPTVVIGLLGYALISRQGPFGSLQLLFTPAAMIFGQSVLAGPIIIVLTQTAVQATDPRVRRTAIVLGASRLQAALLMMQEARYALIASIVAGFGRVIGEVGTAMMLGGNIKGYTRTLSTAIALETSKGEFSFGLALGIVLMSIASGVNMLLRILQQKRA
ncbi:ABC transporter permease [candidate division KSB3 bacterium]|uniref:ABC transporter permease n=1 Tax=candidate division KSB3 bacterium TaxID=2044937 RepID=A0A2G6E5H3_9BACT|nr:MAG: ABC transporter permease [candidate division KSB3 bacterium]PIE29854.1 MAG: ABC transporter permease [candidate division KSB3 bacterium]